jgi:hypothetical protein
MAILHHGVAESAEIRGGILSFSANLRVLRASAVNELALSA